MKNYKQNRSWKSHQTFFGFQDLTLQQKSKKVQKIEELKQNRSNISCLNSFHFYTINVFILIMTLEWFEFLISKTLNTNVQTSDQF